MQIALIILAIFIGASIFYITKSYVVPMLKLKQLQKIREGQHNQINTLRIPTASAREEKLQQEIRIISEHYDVNTYVLAWRRSWDWINDFNKKENE